MGIKEKREEMCRSSIALKMSGKEEYKPGKTRFGGRPDVPFDFNWPVFEEKDCDGVVKTVPLTFLAQFNCEELVPYDAEHLLPDHGLLSFFYDTDGQPWGFDPDDAGGARVFWFEDISVLREADYPADMKEDIKLPAFHMEMEQKNSFPDWEDFSEIYSCDEEEFELLQMETEAEEQEKTKLLGWPDIIQDSMAVECELIAKGYYLGGSWENIPKTVWQQAKATALDKWYLLFQLDTMEESDFSMMFGDCGRIYFYIPREDLLERRFERVWAILQCE